MAEETPTPKKKGKKPGTGQKVAIGLGGAVVVYILYRWYQNRSTGTTATTANTDPLTGQPYSAGVGSLAPGASGASGTTTPDPTIDPATGQTWASEVTAAGTDPATGQPYSSEVTQLESLIPSGPSVSTGTGSGTPPEGETMAASRAALIADVAKATGLSTKVAGQQVALYLEGKPLTHIGAVHAIGNQVRVGKAPSNFGTRTLPKPTLARSVTQARRPTAHAQPLKR